MTAAPGETEVVIAALHKRLEHIPWETEAMYQLASDALALIRSLSERLARVEAQVQALLSHCPDAECHECGAIICPTGEPLHFHHDGCPACVQDEPAAAIRAGK